MALIRAGKGEAGCANLFHGLHKALETAQNAGDLLHGARGPDGAGLPVQVDHGVVAADEPPFVVTVKSRNEGEGLGVVVLVHCAV